MSAWMQSFGVAFQSVAQLFLLGLIGWVAVKRGIITQAVIKALAALMIDLLIPALLFMAMLRGFDVRKLSQMGAVFGLSIAWIFFGFALGWLGARLWPRPGNDLEDRAVIAMAGIQNSFYLPMPLVAALLPAEKQTEGLLYIGVAVIALSVCNWTFAPLLLSRRGGAEGEPAVGWAARTKKILLNPPLLGIAAGCVAAQVPLLRDAVRLPLLPDAARGAIDGWIVLVALPLRALDLLVPCIAPLAMILLGSVLATHPLAEHHRWRSSLLVGLVRLLLIPGLVLCSALLWLPAGPVCLLVLAVEAGAPPATNLTIIALRYGDQGGHVSSTLLVTYLASLLTLPMWIGVVGALYPF